MEVKTAIFWESDLKNKLPISEFHQIWTPSFLSSSIYDTHFWMLFAQFGDIDIAKEINTPEFWKVNKRIGFDLLEMQKGRSLKFLLLFGSDILIWEHFVELWKMTS